LPAIIEKHGQPRNFLLSLLPEKSPYASLFPPIILLEYPFSGSLMGGPQMVVFQVETPPEHILLDNR